MSANSYTELSQAEESCGILRCKKAPPKREERRFEINLSTAAAYMRCAYIKIPDPIYTKKKAKSAKDGTDGPEHLRPFDGIFVTPKTETNTGATYSIEAKYGDNVLSTHQRNYLSIVKKANGCAYVIRMRHVGKQERYYVEWPEKNVLMETDNLPDFIKWFKDLTEIKK